LEEVQRLLEAGADATFIDDPPGVWGSCSRKGPLHVAISHRPWPREDASEAEVAEQFGRWKSILKLLVCAKADVNAKSAEYDWRGCGSTRTAFEMVMGAAMKDVELLELFLSAGGDANTKSVRHVHSMRTDGEAIHYLIHSAVNAADLEVARALLDARADVDAIDSRHFANERGHNQATDETALHQACSKPDLAMAALLLARGADVNLVRRDLELVALDVDSPTDDPRDPEYVRSTECVPVRETALHLALRRGDADLVVLLVCAGADITCHRKRGGETFSCEDLCAGNESLLKALQTEWTPETHRLFPAKVRESVEAALQIARRQQWPLPETVLFRVCALAAGGPTAPSSS